MPTRRAQSETAEDASAAPADEEAAAARGQAYGAMIEALREFLDKAAAARPDEATLQALTGDLEAWSRRLGPFEVGERDQLFARLGHLPGRGTTLIPKFTALESDEQQVRGVATFGRYFLGGGGAAHGGTIPLLLDDLIGRLANTGGRPLARVVSLRTDYRSVTPLGQALSVSARFVSEEGRKRVLRAEIRHGDTLCAEAEALFITLQPGQAWTELKSPQDVS